DQDPGDEHEDQDPPGPALDHDRGAQQEGEEGEQQVTELAPRRAEEPGPPSAHRATISLPAILRHGDSGRISTLRNSIGGLSDWSEIVPPPIILSPFAPSINRRPSASLSSSWAFSYSRTDWPSTMCLMTPLPCTSTSTATHSSP